MKSPAINLKQVSLIFIIALLFLGSGNAWGQDEEATKKDTRPVRSTFESTWLIDNQTVMVPLKGTFELDMQHRFGLTNNKFDDFYGIYGPATIRFGFDYVPIENLQIGLGFSNVRLHWDFHAKYAFLKQARSGGSPVSMSYLVNMAIDTRDKENHLEFIDRMSYFHQLMIARKFSDRISLQVSGNLSYLNYPRRTTNEETGAEELMSSDHFSISVLGKIKITEGIGLIFNYDHPITEHGIEALEPEPNLALGIENVTSSHAFQVFIGNYQSIVPQLNNVTNRNNFGDGELAIGFNITRLWNF